MKTNQKHRVLTLVVGALVLFGATALLVTRHHRAAVAQGIPTTDPLYYAGLLADGAGKPIVGQRYVGVDLYESKTATTTACSTAPALQTLVAGRFRLALHADCLEAIRSNPNLWVELKVGVSASTLTSMPRTKVGAAPYAVESNNGVPVGTVLPYAGDRDNVPAGWLLCDGTSVKQSAYPALFKVIGAYYGNGKSSTEFNLPDYQGRFLRGADPTGKVDPDVAKRTANNANGGNTGATKYKVGSVQGDEVKKHRHNSATGHDFVISGGTKTTTSGKDIPFASSGSTSTAYYGGGESRPVNAYVNYIIKY